MRVDYFGFFLKIKSVLVMLDFGLLHLAIVVLSVVGEKNLGIGVLDESISASGVSNTFITDGQLLNYSKKETDKPLSSKLKLLTWSCLSPNSISGFFTRLSSDILSELSEVSLL